MSSPAPRYRHFSVAAVETLLGRGLHDRVEERCGEIAIHVGRDGLAELLRDLRDTHEYQQLMEIVGVDYPERSERFEVVYCLLSLTQNHRVRVHVSTDEDTPVPSVTGLWPNAGWLEREVFDMYGVTFAGNADLRRILTDYGFEGYPLRKDFPQTGYVELRYSEAEKRVIYEPVELPQDFRNFDFLMPWEGTDYKLPGDEKAATPPPAPAAAPTPKVTEKTSDTGAGKGAEKEANKAAKKPVAKKAAAPKAAKKAEPKRTPRKKVSK